MLDLRDYIAGQKTEIKVLSGKKTNRVRGDSSIHTQKVSVFYDGLSDKQTIKWVAM
jgi:hypothetical protein